MTAQSYSRIAGANDRMALGSIGAGGRGSYVMSLFQKDPRVEVRAACDVYGERIDRSLSKAPGARGIYDHRKMLEEVRELDVVLVATPDHWQAATTIDALEAGEDVYVEKPLMRLGEEGPRIAKAACVNRRICQETVGRPQPSATGMAAEPYRRPDLTVATGESLRWPTRSEP